MLVASEGGVEGASGQRPGRYRRRQEAFLRAYRQLGRFESRANFGTWLYRIVANCSVDLMRAKQARHDMSKRESLDEAVELPTGDAVGPDRLAQSAETS